MAPLEPKTLLIESTMPQSLSNILIHLIWGRGVRHLILRLIMEAPKGQGWRERCELSLKGRWIR